MLCTISSQWAGEGDWGADWTDWWPPRVPCASVWWQHQWVHQCWSTLQPRRLRAWRTHWSKGVPTHWRPGQCWGLWRNCQGWHYWLILEPLWGELYRWTDYGHPCWQGRPRTGIVYHSLLECAVLVMIFTGSFLGWSRAVKVHRKCGCSFSMRRDRPGKVDLFRHALIVTPYS